MQNQLICKTKTRTQNKTPITYAPPHLALRELGRKTTQVNKRKPCRCQIPASEIYYVFTDTCGRW
jgi:hypothetical protein